MLPKDEVLGEVVERIKMLGTCWQFPATFREAL